MFVTTEQTVRVEADRERALLHAVLATLGATDAETRVVADVLLEADLRGQGSHGLLRLPMIARRVRAGLIRPGAAAQVRWTTPALGQMDAQAGFGQFMADQAMRQVAERARHSGIAALCVRNNNHIGMLAYYAEQAARLGTVAIVLTTSEALVTPHGGAEALVGTNPIAVGFPACPEPFVLDMATSATALGKIIESAHHQAPLPEGWAVAADGAPTTDADAALLGALLPFGGAKGFGMGLAVELLAGAMVGAALGQDVHGTLDADFPSTKGDLFIAIDARWVPGAHDLGERTSAYLERIRTSRPAPGADRVTVPGDGARARRADSLRRGVALSRTAWQAALDLLPTGARP